MIAKIKTGAYVKGMVEYNAGRIEKKNKQGDPEAKYLGSNLIFEGSSPSNVVQQITLRNQLANNRYAQTNLHISLNFHENDILTDVAMMAYANEYMMKMGYSEVPYAVYRHLDKAHPHLHIVASQINSKGQKINDSHLHYRSMGISRAMEKEHSLTSPKRKSEKKMIDQVSALNNYTSGNVSLSETLFSLIGDALNEQPTSEDEFSMLLKDRGVVLLKNNGENINGYLYSVDTEEEKYAPAIAGSQIDSSYIFDSIQNELNTNHALKEKYKKQVRAKLKAILNKIDNPITLSSFELLLQKKGLVLTVKRRQSGDKLGEINGYLYKDLKTGIKYNSSELNVRLKDYENKVIDDQKTVQSINLPLSTSSEKKNIEKENIDENYTPDYIASLSNLLDILGPSVGEAQEMDSQKQQKKKRKRRNKK